MYQLVIRVYYTEYGSECVLIFIIYYTVYDSPDA